MLEGPRKETFPPGLRARGKAWGLGVVPQNLVLWRHALNGHNGVGPSKLALKTEEVPAHNQKHQSVTEKQYQYQVSAKINMKQS